MNFIGQGTDIHKIKKTRKQNKIVLGGYGFVLNYKIVAHSDGDVVLHSIANAILGSCQAGDIGEYFSDEEEKNKNMNSQMIVEKALKILESKKMKMINADITIVCEKILLKNHKKEISNCLGKILNCKNVNVKATRFEKRTNYIQCESIVLVSTI